MKKKRWKYRVSIVGLGNFIMGDDGAGIHLIKELREERIVSDVNLIEAGAAPLNYLGRISQSKEIIALDAIKGGEKAGTIYRLDLNDLEKTIVSDSHGCSLFDVIKMAQSMTGFPVKVYIYGIEPENINLQIDLSEPVKKAILKIKKMLINKLK